MTFRSGLPRCRPERGTRFTGTFRRLTELGAFLKDTTPDTGTGTKGEGRRQAQPSQPPELL